MPSHQKSTLAMGNGPLYQSLPSLELTGRIGVMFLLTVFHIWLAIYLPPADDELYYWSWAQHLQPSYFDHPPMVAYFIRASTAVFGDTIFGIRAPAILTSLFVFIGLLFLAPRGKLVWAMLLCPLALLGSVLMTPDIPLLLFWTLYAFWFAWTNATLDSWNTDPITRVYQNSPVTWHQWILGGALLGFGGLSKYTMLLAVPCGLTVLATRTRFRAWGPGYAFHLLVAAILVWPVFLFNWHSGFAPLSFQWHHAMSAVDSFSITRWFRFIGGQIALLGALPFLLFPWIALRYRDLCAEAKSHAYFCFFVFPFSFFLYKAFSTRLEANWALVAYVTFWPVADRLLSWSSFRGIVRGVVVIAFLAPWAVSALILIHFASPFQFLHPRFDRVAVLRGQWETAQQIAQDVRASGYQAPLLGANYQWTSYWRFLKLPSQQGIPGGRPSQFTLSAPSTCDAFGTLPEILSVDVADAHSSATPCFANREILKTYLIQSRGQEVGRVWLTRYSH